MISRRSFLQHASAAALAAGPPAGAADPKLLERARALLASAPLIDTHNDLPSSFLNARGGDLTPFDMSKVQLELCADIPRLRQGRVGAQYWSIYTNSNTMKTHVSLHEAMREFDVAIRFIASKPELEQARTAADIERICRAGRIACLLGVEGGHMIENSPAALRVFFALGARYLTLTHWANVDWADAATDVPEAHGLTELGKKLVKEMNRLGMFADLSHVSPETMHDTLSVTRAPIIFSHSNARALTPHPRGVPDDVLRRIPANGGVVHVNFIKQFVSPKTPAWEARRLAVVRDAHATFESDQAVAKAIADWEKNNPAPRGTISDVADHIDHIRKLAGIDHIGIGADYYVASGEDMVEGLEDVTKYPYVFAELLRRGYSDDDVVKIAGQNHLRAMRKMEQVAAALQKTESPLITETAPIH